MIERPAPYSADSIVVMAISTGLSITADSAPNNPRSSGFWLFFEFHLYVESIK
jgi:hypothetical protein